MTLQGQIDELERLAEIRMERAKAELEVAAAEHDRSRRDVMAAEYKYYRWLLVERNK